ncbi:hypothetical protein HN51_044369 [Arachis hypogaea]
MKERSYVYSKKDKIIHLAKDGKLEEAPHWLTYDFPPQIREKLNIQWGSDWKGQAQKWFLFKFTSQDQEINYLGDGTEKAEFGEWSWLPPEKVIELVSNGDCDKHFFTPI